MKYDFDGSCKPGKGYAGQSTFSVGIFPILPKASGKGTKRGAVVVRVKGLCSDPTPVYEKAREICQVLEKGEYQGPKNVSVVK